MKKVMKLTSRHNFPKEATEQIFPDDVSWIISHLDDEHQQEVFRMRANLAIPEGTTELVVYMSGLARLHTALKEVCQARNINLTALWYDNKRKEDSVLPCAYYAERLV